MDMAGSFHLFLIIVLIGLASVAFAYEPIDNIEEESWDEIENEDYIEKRYMSNNQIRNKFIIQNNRLAHITKTLDRLETSDSNDVAATQKRIDAAEVDVKDIQTNKLDIEATLKKSCGYLDSLMDSSSVDCCINGFTVFCLTRSAMQAWDADFDTTSGQCTACPDGLESDR